MYSDSVEIGSQKFCWTCAESYGLRKRVRRTGFLVFLEMIKNFQWNHMMIDLSVIASASCLMFLICLNECQWIPLN